jgi:hypothetical protein
MDQPNPEYRKVKPHSRSNATPMLTPEEARQGVITGRVRWILAVSVTLVVVAFVVLYATYV